MSTSTYRCVSCPCCKQLSLQPNGAFLTCTTCGLAITSQALAKAVRYTGEPAAHDPVITTVSH